MSFQLQLWGRAGGCLVLLVGAAGCRHAAFPDVPEGYREFAYVSNGASNTVSVLDLVYLRPDRTLKVGSDPSGLAVNPVRDEVYVANAQSGTVSVIDTARNEVTATIGVGRLPYELAVSADGARAFVANSGSNSVSVIDLLARRVVGTLGTGEQPGVARVAADGRSLVVTNRGSGSVSVFDVTPGATPRLRASYSGCAGATDAVVLPDSSKAFVACSGGHQVMAVGLAVAPGTWAAKRDSSLLADHMLALLDVGQTPVHLALKPDGGEVFASNFDSDSVTEIATGTNEVGGTTLIGSRPVRGVVSADNGTLWVADFGADTISVYGIDDGKLVGSVHTGSGPDAMAFSADEHLLLAVNAHSGDVAVIRTQGRQGAALFTMLPVGRSPNAIVVKAMQGR